MTLTSYFCSRLTATDYSLLLSIAPIVVCFPPRIQQININYIKTRQINVNNNANVRDTGKKKVHFVNFETYAFCVTAVEQISRNAMLRRESKITKITQRNKRTM